MFPFGYDVMVIMSLIAAKIQTLTDTAKYRHIFCMLLYKNQ